MGRAEPRDRKEPGFLNHHVEDLPPNGTALMSYCIREKHSSITQTTEIWALSVTATGITLTYNQVFQKNILVKTSYLRRQQSISQTGKNRGSRAKPMKLNSGSVLPSCVILGELLNLSES